MSVLYETIPVKSKIERENQISSNDASPNILLLFAISFNSSALWKRSSSVGRRQFQHSIVRRVLTHVCCCQAQWEEQQKQQSERQRLTEQHRQQVQQLEQRADTLDRQCRQLTETKYKQEVRCRWVRSAP